MDLPIEKQERKYTDNILNGISASSRKYIEDSANELGKSCRNAKAKTKSIEHHAVDNSDGRYLKDCHDYDGNSIIVNEYDDCGHDYADKNIADKNDEDYCDNNNCKNINFEGKKKNKAEEKQKLTNKISQVAWETFEDHGPDQTSITSSTVANKQTIHANTENSGDNTEDDCLVKATNSPYDQERGLEPVLNTLTVAKKMTFDINTENNGLVIENKDLELHSNIVGKDHRLDLSPDKQCKLQQAYLDRILAQGNTADGKSVENKNKSAEDWKPKLFTGQICQGQEHWKNQKGAIHNFPAQLARDESIVETFCPFAESKFDIAGPTAVSSTDMGYFDSTNVSVLTNTKANSNNLSEHQINNSDELIAKHDNETGNRPKLSIQDDGAEDSDHTRKRMGERMEENNAISGNERISEKWNISRVQFEEEPDFTNEQPFHMNFTGFLFNIKETKIRCQEDLRDALLHNYSTSHSEPNSILTVQTFKFFVSDLVTNRLMFPTEKGLQVIGSRRVKRQRIKNSCFGYRQLEFDEENDDSTSGISKSAKKDDRDVKVSRNTDQLPHKDETRKDDKKSKQKNKQMKQRKKRNIVIGYICMKVISRFTKTTPLL